MEIYVTERPAALPAVCAPLSAVRVTPAAGVPSRPWAHSVPSQAELALVPTSAGFQGINGLVGTDVPTSKRMDVRGVPPRGRPV